MRKLAEVLEIPTCYMYAEEDDLAELIKVYSGLSAKNKRKLLKIANDF